MDDVQWKAPDLVGIALLDAQHLEIHRLIQALMGLPEGPGSAAETEARLNQLTEKIMAHFMAEEEFLAARQYPDLAGHRTEHELLFEHIWAKLIRRHAPNPPPLARVVQDVAELIRDHQQTVDQDYAAWLQGRVRAPVEPEGLPEDPGYDVF